MGWQAVAPDGSKSVKDNNSILNDNTTYIETKMNIDHFWNIGADEDGRHKFAQMPKYTDGLPATPTSPTIGAGMDLAFFSRLKTAAEATAAQDVQPYARNASAIMQLLGIRSCGVFNGSGGATVVYKHNVLSITRTAEGSFTVKFEVADPMPSINYLILCGAMRNNATAHRNIYAVPDAATAVGNIKKTTEFKFHTVDTAGDRIDPLQAWFVVFGG